MNLLGLHLQMLVGGDIPTPAPLPVNEALESVEVTHREDGRSGFQVVFQVGRGLADRADFALLKQDRIRPFNRIVLSVLFGVKPQPIMDGIITTHQLVPSEDPGKSKLTVTGDDVSVMMDLEKEAQSYPQLDHDHIVRLVLAPYAVRYGIVPTVKRPDAGLGRPITEGPTVKPTNSTDLAFVRSLAERHGFVFYVQPGPVPLVNTAYWGPPERLKLPQPALSVNMGPNTNVETISFKYAELPPKRVRFTTSDDRTVTLSAYTRQPRLAARLPQARQLDFLGNGADGETAAAKRQRAQGEVNKSFDNAVTAEGTLDALRYGRILKPRSIVHVRGAGDHFSGAFYVKSVTHSIDVRKGEYKQKFSLSREGVGTTTPLVSV